jgi:ABC-type proline/glycine betaine transport system permease subunit
MDNNKTKLIAAFPGLGKTYFFNNQSYNKDLILLGVYPIVVLSTGA